MLWCPVCKNEYKEGYTHCNDCDVDLVDVLPTPIMFGTKEEMQKMQEVLKQAGFAESYLSYNEKDRDYELAVPAETAEEATKTLKEYNQTEMMEMLGINEDASGDGEALFDALTESAAEKAQESVKKSVYDDKKLKAEEYKSSALTLALVGGVGLILIILHAVGIIPITIPNTTKIMMYLVMGAMFVIFLVSSFFAWKSYKRLLAEDDVDKAFIKEAKEFLSEVSVAQLEEGLDLSDTADEMKYFKRIAALKRILEEKYPNTSEELIDHLAEEYYDEHFGTEYDTTEADSFLEENRTEDL